LSDLTLKIIDILLPAVLALVGAALMLATSYLRARAEAIRHEQAQRMVMGLLQRAHQEVYDAVRATAQTYVDGLKKAREDGKITEEEARQARGIAWQHFKAQMGAVALAELEQIVSDLTEWFASELEAAVGALKAS